MNRTKILLVFGGESSEHEVSVLSARNVYSAINRDKFDVILAYIDKTGVWWLLDDIEENIVTDAAKQLTPVLGTGKFITNTDNIEVKPEVILPILHGRNGEDGSVQGLAQLLHIPIVGCDMTSSSICMDKLATKEVLEAHDILVAPYTVHRQGTPVPDFQMVTEQLGSPIFVKPSRAGSSVGVSKVRNEQELIEALAEAHRHDEVVLIEKAIVGRELEVAMLGNPPDQEASAVGEIVPGDDFYSYDDKYASSSSSKTLVPSPLDEATALTVRNTASNIYDLLGCSGLSRVDFFLAEDGSLYANEVNTIPGFTNISMYPKLWQASGLAYSELIERLISLAR
jgi:D-alanine-D-alanine ligase